MRTSKLLAILLLALALVASACNGGDDDGGDAATDDADAAADDGADEGADDGGDAEPVGEDVSGEITILHAFTGEADVNGLNAVIEAFEEQYPDVTVNDEGSNDFESLARTRIGSGTPPDIALHPQPGLLEDFVDQGVVQPLDFLDRARLDEELVEGQLDVVTFDDTLYAMPLRLSLKSLVWYNKPFWDEQGYEVPEDWDAMLELTDQIATETDLAPWCIGIESGDATGWPSTDWVEDILLRTIGPDQYDAWVAGELDFASEEVQGNIEEYMAPIWTNDEYVNGGTENIAREAFGTSVSGIITGECVMHRQATFIEGFIDENHPDAEFGTDYDFFFLPQIDPEFGEPALGAADLAALYTESEAARAFMEFIATADGAAAWAELGGLLSPFSNFDTSLYPTESTRQAGELLTDASFFRFDGSDLMPGDVGSSSQEGSFWLEMVQWVSGDQELEASMESIDQLYDEIEGS